MLKPFEIDLLRQDLQAALKLLGQDEIEEAHALMRDHGFRPVDFEIVQHADPSPAFPSAVTGIVTLIKKSTRMARTYEAGNGTSWLMLFEHDLKQGAFGPG
jgi:hypothetical protein